jgi:hypothetical protein
MKHDEMVDLLDSLENAKDALLGIEHSKAMGYNVSATERRLFSALKRFIKEWRGISVETVERMIGK